MSEIAANQGRPGCFLMAVKRAPAMDGQLRHISDSSNANSIDRASIITRAARSGIFRKRFQRIAYLAAISVGGDASPRCRAARRRLNLKFDPCDPQRFCWQSNAK
ncbi:MAG: hypothetical protein HY056_17140 [Proteobacteria bacterium]|nr:hypothetical protein [Pseudomonadota bacterium]